MGWADSCEGGQLPRELGGRLDLSTASSGPSQLAPTKAQFAPHPREKSLVVISQVPLPSYGALPCATTGPGWPVSWGLGLWAEVCGRAAPRPPRGCPVRASLFGHRFAWGS